MYAEINSSKNFKCASVYLLEQNFAEETLRSLLFKASDFRLLLSNGDNSGRNATQGRESYLKSMDELAIGK